MAIINIGLANLVLMIDPDTPMRLLKLLTGLGGMKQVREVLPLYDIDYFRAIEEKELQGKSGQHQTTDRSHGSHLDISSEEEEEEEEEEKEEGKEEVEEE